MSYTPRTQLGKGSSISFTPTNGTSTGFLSLVTVTPPGTAVGETENVLINSTFEPYLPTLPAGEGSLTVQHWDGDPGCTSMQSCVQQAPVPLGVFVITLPSLATLTFPGFPKKYAISEIQNKEIITAEIDYRQNGPAVYAPPPSGS